MCMSDLLDTSDVAFGSDGEDICLVVLLVCFAAVIFVMWIDRPLEEEPHAETSQQKSDEQSVSDKKTD